MSALCQTLPQSVAEEMLQVVARAICDRPGDNPAQRDSRTRQMVYSTMGFDPRDGLEYMLTTMVVGHFNLLLDSMFDVFQGQMDTMKARTKSTIVALDRSMLGFVKEMRLSRQRPAVRAAEQSPGAAATLASMDLLPAEQAASEVEAAAAATGIPATAANTAKTADTAKPAPPAPVRIVPAPARPSAAAASSRPTVGEDASLEAHLAEFQRALEAATETLAEARALDGAAAQSASGD